MEDTRINKYLSEIGYCSRRQADKLIEEQRVTINGQIPALGTKVKENDSVEVDGKVVSLTRKEQIYIAFNKPVGIVCTADTKREKNNIIEFINHPERLIYAGRLDKMSEGLILLTTDGEWVNQLMRARNFHEKEYIVEVDQPITEKFLQGMRNGVPILDTITRKCEVEQIDTYSFRIILTQGLNRQIRRMCEYFDYQVKNLKRIRIMNIQLDIPVGKWRDLTASELLKIKGNIS
ncbi:MAG: pseudouridine synthase [Brumimicrobium sp.]|nr:pseudouridine synthase [Brumimicrobium sp.]